MVPTFTQNSSPPPAHRRVSDVVLNVLPGEGAVIANEPLSSGCTRIQLKLPTTPLLAAVSITSRSTWVPAASGTPRTATVVQDCHPPVSGIDTAPVLLTPSASRWNVPPTPGEATRTSIR